MSASLTAVPAFRATAMDAVALMSRLAVIGKFSVPCEVPLHADRVGESNVYPADRLPVSASNYVPLGGGA
jgi:hypothetical protein